MKLRARLALTTLAVAGPLLAVLVVLDAHTRRRGAAELLGRVLQWELSEPGAQAQCERAPTRWADELARRGPPGHDRRGRHGPPHDGPPDHGPPDGPPGLPRGPRAPEFEVYSQLPLPSPLEPGSFVVSTGPWWSEDVAAIARTPWGDGPCAYVVARGTTVPGWMGVLPPPGTWLPPTIVVFATVLLAAGPVLDRIRRLTETVRSAEASGYDLHVGQPDDDEIGELARAFETAGASIRAKIEENERRERALRDFLANTTHDVMIPLTVLQGHLSALRDGDLGRVGPAMDEAQYLGSLLRNLSIAARLEASDPRRDFHPVDLGNVVSRVIARHRPVAAQRAFSLDYAVPAEPVFVQGDGTLLEQALGNFVHNAVRYGKAPEGTRITFSPDARPPLNAPPEACGHAVVVLEREGDRFTLRVMDDGPGIPDERLATVLQRGARGDEARTRAPDGQGLGLSIASRVAALHGLTLTLGRSEFGGLLVELSGPVVPG